MSCITAFMKRGSCMSFMTRGSLMSFMPCLINIFFKLVPFRCSVPSSVPGGAFVERGADSVLRVAARADRRHVIEDVGSAHLVVTEVLDEAGFDDVDLFLRVLGDDGRHQRLQLDRVFLVLEQLELERAA